jgi:hypothetical protein
MSIWDDPELKVNNDFYTFETVGDTASGTVQRIGVKRWDSGQVSPEILLLTDDGDERTLTAGQVRLKSLLAEHRPEVGDHISIVLTEIEKRSMGKTLKHFSLEVKRAEDLVPAGSTPTPAAVDPAVAAALAALSPEQRTAMGLPAA